MGVAEAKGVSRLPWTTDTLFTHLGLHQKGFEARELSAISDLLCKNLSVFTSEENDLGRTHLTLHQIDTGEAKPVKLPPRWVPLHLQHEVSKHLKQMLENDIIQLSHSPGAALVVLVCKQDPGLRFCVDYHKLNDLAHKDTYPLPRIDNALARLSNACLFFHSTLG